MSNILHCSFFPLFLLLNISTQSYELGETGIKVEINTKKSSRGEKGNRKSLPV